MSKARLIISAVVHEGRSQAEVARAYGVTAGWVSKLLARYRAEGEAAFEPRSRRPHSSPNATPVEVVELIIMLRKKLTRQGLHAGPETIAWHLARPPHKLHVAPATISRHLTRAGLVEAQPQKRPRSSYIRFRAEYPNETWQSDFTHVLLFSGSTTEVIGWIDDHSRKMLHLSAHRRVTGNIVLTTFRETVAEHGIPASTLTDNGMVFTTRLAGGKGGRNAFEHELRALNIHQKNSRPNHPTTCGKIEHLWSTLKLFLAAYPQRARTIAELQTRLDAFSDEYNNRRPHQELEDHCTPSTAYQALPKASPGHNRGRDSHDRVRRDIIDPSGVITWRHAGRLHHIGIGRTHKGTHVIVLAQDLNIRVIHATTGELLRELTLDTEKDYQRQPKNP
jgi:transposase InsO family protein